MYQPLNQDDKDQKSQKEIPVINVEDTIIKDSYTLFVLWKKQQKSNSIFVLDSYTLKYKQKITINYLRL